MTARSATATVPNGTTRVSVASGGAEANGRSLRVDISGSGSTIVFESEATNLVSGDTNGERDIFVHNRGTGVTTRVSAPPGGAEPNGVAYEPAIARDGFWIAFSSTADNLVPGDSNFSTDVFIVHRQFGTTSLRRVSIASDGSQGNGPSFQPAISDNGRFIAFVSMATNVALGAPAFGWQVYLHDRNPDLDAVWDEPGQILTTPVSIDAAGGFANDIAGGLTLGRVAVSDDGMTIAFASRATNLVTGDTNGVDDVFVHRRDPDNNGIPDEPGQIETVRVSVSSAGDAGDGPSYDPQISANGRYVSFLSDATNLVAGDTNGATDVFVHDLAFDNTTRVSVSSSGAQNPGVASGQDIDGTGRFVTFHANQSTLTAPTCIAILDCVYRHDRQTGDTVLISRNEDGQPSWGHAYQTAVADGGREIAFLSDNAFMVPGDTNGVVDAYVFDEDDLPQGLSAFINLPTGRLPNGQHVLPWGSPSHLTVPLQLAQPYTSTVTLGVSITAPDGGVTEETVDFPAGVTTGTVTLLNPFPEVNATYRIQLENGTAPGDEPDDLDVTVVPQGVVGPLQQCPACLLAALLDAVGLSEFLGCGFPQAPQGNPGWLDTLYAVRDDVMATTPAGRYYTALYYGHAPEIAQILLENPALIWKSWDGARAWAPALAALVQGSGSGEVITPELLTALDTVLTEVESSASPTLLALIQSERAALDLPSFEGLTMDEAWAQVNDRPVGEIYLPQTPAD